MSALPSNDIILLVISNYLIRVGLCRLLLCMPVAQNSKLKTQYLALALLLILYLIVAFTHTYLAPLTIGPDELAHYEYMNFIAEHGRLPLDKDERGQASYKSDQPPLYHLLAALPASLVDPSGPPYLKRVQDHKRRQLIERTRHAWGLYNTEDERWPYQGEVLRWQVGRWVGVLFGAATVFVTFFMAREAFAWINAEATKGEGSPGVTAWVAALGAAAIVAFIPRFALTGSMLNYETTLAFFSAVFLWVLLRIANPKSTRNQHKTRNTKHILLLGLFAGLAITAKLSALILPLEVVMALWLIGRTYGWTWKIWLRHILVAAVATLVAVSWWFGFVIYQFNTVATDGLWAGLLKPLIAADSSDATTNRLLSFLTSGQAGFTGAIDNLDSGPPWEWLAIFFRTFWVVGIEQHQPLGLWGLVVALGLVLLAAYGLVVAWRTIRHSPSLRLVLFLLLLHLFAAFILPLARYAITFSLADTAQGRHVLFQTAPAFAILLVWGIMSITNYQLPIINYQWSITNYQLPIKSYLSHFAILFPGLFLLFWSGVQLWTMTWAYNPLLPVQTRPIAQAQVTHPVHQPLNEFVTLLGYNSYLGDENQILHVDLLWQATAISPVDYLTEVKLIDKQGAVQAEWLGYSASGRYPTRAWDVSDIVRDTVWLPIGGLEAGQYDLTLNLRAVKLKRQPPEVSFSLGSVAISDSTPRIFNNSLPFTGTAQAAAGYSIWQNGKPLTEPQVFRYRETVLITFSSLLPDQQRTVRLIGPNVADPTQERSFAPVYESDMMALFIVGPDWPTGDYRLQVTLTTSAVGGEQLVNTGPLLHVIDHWERQFDDSFSYQQVEANFADQVKLLGYDLGANRAEAGGGIPLTLYWQGLDWMGDDYTIFTKLLAADQTVHGGRDRLPQEGYSTLYWAPGEIIPDSFGVPVDDDAPDGIYYVNVGLYKQVNQQALSLPLVQDGQPLDATSINIGPIKIGNTPPGLTVNTANPHVELNQPFGDPPALTLLGYNLTDEADQPITNYQYPKGTPLSIINYQSLKLTLYWRSEAILSLDYTTFVHIRNEAGEIVAQKDQLPLNGAYPTSLWNPGEIIVDEITVPWPTELSGGDYQIVIGLYDFQTGQRLMVPDNPANEVKLTGVKVP